MLRDVVSGLGIGFFPIAAMLLFVAVYASVIIRMWLTTDRRTSEHLSRMALDGETGPMDGATMSAASAEGGR